MYQRQATIVCTCSGSIHTSFLLIYTSQYRIISKKVVSDEPPNDGFHFPGTGAVAIDSTVYGVCGGLVYAYSNITNTVRFWHPVGDNGSLIHVTKMGNGTNNQLSSIAIVNIQFWKGELLNVGFLSIMGTVLLKDLRKT